MTVLPTRWWQKPADIEITSLSPYVYSYSTEAYRSGLSKRIRCFDCPHLLSARNQSATLLAHLLARCVCYDIIPIDIRVGHTSRCQCHKVVICRPRRYIGLHLRKKLTTQNSMCRTRKGGSRRIRDSGRLPRTGRIATTLRQLCYISGYN